ncbi:hypothetical protein [Cryobacterium fucosi]|uniref:hypothetical protein n=1 Tax=Cryobacterium fucosi TaxID=1259157 RepID=UPI00141AE0D7|nr:hypothetical protein [Cryobacterium fucosi]
MALLRLWRIRPASARHPPGIRPASARPPPGLRPASARPPPGLALDATMAGLARDMPKPSWARGAPRCSCA